MEWQKRFLWKRAFDIILVVFFLMVPSLLISGLVYLLMYIFYGGEVLYPQQRIGYGGKEFTLYKFRTMKNGDERNEIDEQAQLKNTWDKKKKDPRVFFLGGLMRLFRIDELPQLINIFKGDMSFAGPRPLQPEESRVWEEKFGEEKMEKRHSVPPGLSGRAQTHGRAHLTEDEKLEMDLQYIDRISLLEDIKTLIRTVPVVLFGINAY